MTANWKKPEIKKTQLMLALLMLSGLTLAFSMPIARMHIDPNVVFASVLTESGTQLFFENTLAFLAETIDQTNRDDIDALMVELRVPSYLRGAVAPILLSAAPVLQNSIIDLANNPEAAQRFSDFMNSERFQEAFRSVLAQDEIAYERRVFGVARDLMQSPNWPLGTLVLVFAILLPVLKTLWLLFLSTGLGSPSRKIFDWLGKFTMVEPFIVVVLVVALNPISGLTLDPGYWALGGYVAFTLASLTLLTTTAHPIDAHVGPQRLITTEQGGSPASRSMSKTGTET